MKISATPTKLYLLANYVNFAFLVLLNLWLTPILLGTLGAAHFGLWKACQRFLDFSSMADGRATQALKWVIAHRSSSTDEEGNRRQVGAALVVWLVWLPVLTTVLLISVYATPYLIDEITADQFQLARQTALVLAASMFLSGLFSIPGSVLIGEGQGYRTVSVSTIVLILSSISMAIAATFGFNTVSLAAITGAAAALNGAVTWWIARRRIAWWGVARPSRGEVGALSRFSGWTLLWALAHQLMISTELILFAALLGLTQVAQYSVTAYVSQSVLIVLMLTASAMAPGLGSLIGSRQFEAATARVREMREVILAIATVAGGSLLLLNSAFVALWAGSKYFLGFSLNALIVLAFFQFALIRCDAQILDATLNARTRAIAGAVVAVAALMGGLLLFEMTGRIELVYLSLIGCRLILNFVYALIVRRELPRSSYPWGRCIVALTVLLGCYALGHELGRMDWGMFAMSVALGGAGLGVLAYAALLSSATRARLRIQRISGVSV